MQNFIQNRVFGNSDAGINLSNRVIQESEFTDLDVSVLKVRHTTFNSCVFRSCDFTTQMIEGCIFYGCDFSNCKLEGASLLSLLLRRL